MQELFVKDGRMARRKLRLTRYGRYQNVVYGLVEIADGLVRVSTLGCIQPMWVMRLSGWMLRQHKRRYGTYC